MKTGEPRTIIAYGKEYECVSGDQFYRHGKAVYLHKESEDKDYLVGCFRNGLEADEEMFWLVSNNVDKVLKCRNPLELDYFRYDMIGADIDYGVSVHPQEQMERLGYELVRCEPVPIADCWIFEVIKDDSIDPPGYLDRLEGGFDF